MIGRDSHDILPGPDTSAPELVPVDDFAALTFADVQPQAATSGDGPALADLIEDVLFGEVIDISDLIPHLLSYSAGAAAPGVAVAEAAAAAEFGVFDGGDAMAAEGHPALTILYDDDILASGSTIL